uniref:PDZ domain-containing protein n=1 Tax=Lutzomyia longipalpis TaxID=7200 RepID=A0A1B0CML3_LUTLO
MEYVTVVSVDNGATPGDCTVSCGDQMGVLAESKSPDSQFITVLAIGDSAPGAGQVVEHVVVYRLPGERLGFGLKFQGGTKSNEKIQRLFIQSCAPDSPASRATASWGFLREGDEILEIDGVSVTRMTRIECVRCLKESNVAIKLVVRNGEGRPADVVDTHSEGRTNTRPPKPPPVPPRKLSKRRVEPTEQPPATQSTREQQRHSLRAENGFTPPPDAEFYLNLFSEENDSNFRGSESDDTGSTISTVIDKYKDVDQISVNSSKSVELAKVLKPFQLLEKEFNVENTGKLEECLLRLQPPVNFQDEQENDSNFRGSESDDTGSTISTVIDKYKDVDQISVNSSKSVELAKVLKPFQLLEKEFNVENTGKLEECLLRLQPPVNFQDEQVIIVQDEQKVRIVNESPPQGEPTRVKVDGPIAQPESDYENVTFVATQRRSEAQKYENVAVEPLPPKPLPRLMVEPKVRTIVPTVRPREAAPKTPPESPQMEYTTIESWLQGTHDGARESHPVKQCIKVTATEDDDGYGESSSDEDVEKVYEPILMEKRDSSDGEEGEKLGPPELLAGPGPSEAYFNFHWSSPLIPTVVINGGEEVSSASPQAGLTEVSQKMDAEVDGRAESDNVTEALVRDSDAVRRDYVANGSDKGTTVDAPSPGRAAGAVMREEPPSESCAISVPSDVAACGDSAMEVTKIERIILGTEHGCGGTVVDSTADCGIASEIRNTNADEGTPEAQQVTKTAQQDTQGTWKVFFFFLRSFLISCAEKTWHKSCHSIFRGVPSLRFLPHRVCVWVEDCM